MRKKRGRIVKVKINDLLRGIEVERVGCADNLYLGGIAYDSRKVEKDDLFAALAGVNTDGNKYISQAIASGAGLILSSAKQNVPVAQIIADNSSFGLTGNFSKFL